jgi:hypothetical protein
LDRRDLKERRECPAETEKEDCLEHPAPRANQGSGVCQECLEIKEKEGTKDLQDQKDQQVIREWRAMTVQLACPECLVKWVLEAFLAREDLPDFQGRQEFLGPRDLLEQKEMKGPWDHPDRPECLETMVLLDRRDQSDRLDHPVNQVQEESLVCPAYQGQMDMLAMLVILESQAKRERKDQQGTLDRWAFLDLGVSKATKENVACLETRETRESKETKE